MTREERWSMYYQAAKDYYLEYGNLNVPSDYKTEDGIKLGAWIKNIRRRYSYDDLKDEYVELLNEIKMIWNLHDDSWYKYYEKAKEYYLKYGDLDIPFDYEINKLKLGQWLKNQRVIYKKGVLSNERLKLLEEIDIKWSLQDDKWDEYYYALEQYKDLFGDVNPKKNYMIDNLNLFAWKNAQRTAYSKGNMNKDHIMLLNDLEFDWSPRDTFFLNREIIDENKYNKVMQERMMHILEDISYELKNNINNSKDQSELESVIIKRMWR